MHTSANQFVPACPYVGLQPYTAAEHDYFFGRAQDTETIAANLLTAPLTLLYGASGVGKTSVLAAGVVPYLRAVPAVLVVMYRSWQDETFLAGLYDSIERAAVPVTPAPAGARAALSPRPLSAMTSRDTPLDEFLARAAQATNRTLLLILDQFEEYSLYHPNPDPFDEQLARAVNRDDVNVNILLSLREDALSQLDRFEKRIPNLMSNYLRLEHLNRDGAEHAIRKPLAVYNARRASEPPIEIEQALVDGLIDQVGTGRVILGQVGQGVSTSPSADPRRERIEAPFLQMVLTRVWDEEMRAKSTILRLATLQQLGGAEKIVRTHLDAVMSKLIAPEQQVCSSFFDRLVTPSGAKIAQGADDLATYAERPAARVMPVLKKLADARVLRSIAPPLGQPQTARYEIFHDVLAPAILDWRRRYVERARFRKYALALAGVGLLVIVFAALALFAFQQMKISTAREYAATAILNLDFDPERSILLAIESLDEARTLEGESALHEGISVSLVREKMTGHTKPVRSAVYSSDGKQILTASDDQTARIWDAKTGRELLILRGHTGTVNGAAYSPDGSRILTASDDKTARLWDATTGRTLTILSAHQDIVGSASFSPDGKLVVTASNDRTVRVWDAVTGQMLQSLKGHTDAVNSAVFRPDGKRIVTASKDQTIRQWDVTSGLATGVTILEKDAVLNAAFSPDGSRIVSPAGNGSVKVWDAETGKEVLAMRRHSDTVWSAVYSPDGNYIVTASNDWTARLWDAKSGVDLSVVRGHSDRVNTAAFSPDSQQVVTASWDRSVRIWDIRAGEVAVLRGHSNQANSVAFSPDGKQVVTASDDRSIRVYDTKTWQQTSSLTGHEGNVVTAVFSPDGQRIVTASEDASVRVWDPANKRQLMVLKGDAGSVNSAAYSPDGKQIMTAYDRHKVLLWDSTSGERVDVLDAPAGDAAVLSAAYSPDGKWIVAASEDGTAHVLDGVTKRDLFVLRGHTDWVNSAAFSPDGKLIVTASSDRTARVWDVATQRTLFVLRGHTSYVRTAVFGPDGKTIVTASGDGSVRVWDAETGRELGTLRGHLGGVSAATYSPDGRYIATAGGDGTSHIYFTHIDDLLDLAKKRVTRELSCDERQKYLHRNLSCP